MPVTVSEQYILNNKDQVVAYLAQEEQELIILSKDLVLEVCPEDYGDGHCKIMRFKGKSFVMHLPKRGVMKEEIEGYK